MRKICFFTALLMLCGMAYSADKVPMRDGDYLNKLTMEYRTPSVEFSTTGKKLKVLFILNRTGARDAVELMQMMPCDYDYVLTFDRKNFATGSYERFMKGTSFSEKRREFTRKLNKDYDVIILGGITLDKLPKAQQNRLIAKVKKGTSLLQVVLTKEDYKLHKNLQGKKLDIPFKNWIEADISAYQAGKGRVVNVVWQRATPYNEPLSLVAEREYSSYHRSYYLSDLANIAMLARFAANCPTKPEAPQIRVRDLHNNIVNEKNLAGSKYFRDIIGKNGAFAIEPFEVASPVGKLELILPRQSKKALFSGSAFWEKADNRVEKIQVEMVDSPYKQIWSRKVFPVAKAAKSVNFKVDASLLQSMAGYVRIALLDKNDQVLVKTEQCVFFPDRSFEDYYQIAWAAARNEIYAAQSVGRLNWRYVITAGWDSYVTRTAQLDQKLLSYTSGNTIEIMGDKNGVIQKLNRKSADIADGDYCFYRPESLEIWRKEAAECYRELEPVLYNLGDELRYSYNAGYGKQDQKYFREFLKKQYGTLAKLNSAWQKDFKSFEEIDVNFCRSPKNFTAWFDHRRYMEKMYADVLHFLRSEIKKFAPDTPVGCEGSMPGDIEQSMKDLEYWGPYQNNVYDEVIRSFGKDKYRTLWWGGYMNFTHGSRHDYPMLHVETLLKGSANGNAFFASFPGHNHGGISSDHRIAEYVQKWLPVMDKLKAGTAHYMIKNDLVNQGIYIYWSHASRTALMLDDRCGDPLARTKLFGMNDDTLNMHDWAVAFWDAEVITPIMRWAYHRGEGFDFVSSRTLDRLKNNHAKVLFMAGCSALSDKEAAAIEEFVKNGGTVIADFLPGILDENLTPRKTGALSKLFGKTGFAEAPKAVMGKVDHKLFKAAETHVTGEPVIVKNYGKGKAILLNFALQGAFASADKTTPFDGFIDQLVPLKKPCVITPALTDGMVRIRKHADFTSYGILNILDPVWRPGLLQKDSLPGKLDRKYTVTLPEKQYIYKVNSGFVGFDNKFTVDFDQADHLNLYSTFASQQSAPVFAVKSAVRGKVVQWQHPELKKGRIYRLDVFDCNGKKVRELVFDTPANRPKWAFPLNSAAGKYTASLTDVATDLAATVKFELK
ncbi:MAG: beta-galactosidase [Lentisphaeria bacterium]|nr:beta-galactosidase [Lentisphaeria bacterium]